MPTWPRRPSRSNSPIGRCRATESHSTLISLCDAWLWSEGSVATDYLIADFDAAGCDASIVDLTVRYETSHAFADFTRRVAVSLPRTIVGLPAVRSPWADTKSPHPMMTRVWNSCKSRERHARFRSCAEGRP